MTKIISLQPAVRFSITIFLLALSAHFIYGNPEPKNSPHFYVSHYENVLGTSLELKISTASEQSASIAETAVLNEITRLTKILSSYDKNSEFSRWFQTINQPIFVSSELYEVLNLFDQWRIRSHGALDASAEVIGKLWKQAADQQRIPSKEELDRVVAEVKQQHWKLDPVARTATHLSITPLALNSFVKSYIIKKAAEAAMTDEKVTAVVVNIGGDLVISGNLSETVRISDPKADAENDAPIDRLQVINKAVATSGNYRRGEWIKGTWYSHIVDPRTGIPTNQILSATVVASCATDAGALATAFNVLSISESVKLAAGFPGVEYLIIAKNGEQVESKGWKSIELSAEKPKANSTKPSIGKEWINDFELIVNLEIKLQNEQFTKRPYVAIWIEDQNHAPIRTVALWHERDRYLPELKAWYLKYRRVYSSDKSILNSVSSATRSPGKYSVKWDGKDDNGNIVPPGVYTLKIEASREHGTYQLMRQELEYNETPKLINLTGNVEIAAASIDYRKKLGTN